MKTSPPLRILIIELDTVPITYNIISLDTNHSVIRKDPFIGLSILIDTMKLHLEFESLYIQQFPYYPYILQYFFEGDGSVFRRDPLEIANKNMEFPIEIKFHTQRADSYYLKKHP